MVFPVAEAGLVLDFLIKVTEGVFSKTIVFKEAIDLVVDEFTNGGFISILELEFIN
jgi:hypothetical protein